MPDSRGDLVRLFHIRDAVIEIKNYTNELHIDDFKASSVTQNAKHQATRGHW